MSARGGDMDAPAALKALKPEGWPDRIYVGKAVVRFPNGTESGSWYNRPITDGDVTTDYIRTDLMAELVEAVTALSAAYRTWSLIPRRRDGEKQAFEQMHTCKVALDATLAKIKEPQT